MKRQRSKVFEQTYRAYLEEIRQIDFLAKAESLGVKTDNGSLRIPLYKKMYSFNEMGIVSDDREELSVAVQVMICKYILTCPSTLPELDNKLVSYREFKDAGPLISYFTTNTNKTLESTFCGNVSTLQRRALDLGATIQESESYDLSLEFHAFPRVPVLLNFNDRDDLFSASCSVLYRASAVHFLDMECLAMTGTLLAGQLIGSQQDI